jgi:hypothetical protein
VPVTPFRRGFLGRSRAAPTPEQQMNDAALEQEKVNQVLAEEDARYDAMTDEEREKYYVKPSAMTKFKKYFRGE